MSAGAVRRTPSADEARWTAVRDAFAPFATQVRPCAGGVLLEEGPVPLAATGAVWLPDPARLEGRSDDDRRSAAHAWIVPSEAAVALAERTGRSAVLGLALAPDADASSGGPSLGGGTRGHGPRDRAWDGAAEVARRLAREAGAEASDWTDALAVLLASWAAHDPDLRLIVDDATDAAAVVVERPDRTVVALHAGGASLARRLASEAVATGREALVVRAVDPDDAAAELVRLEPVA